MSSVGMPAQRFGGTLEKKKAQALFVDRSYVPKKGGEAPAISVRSRLGEGKRRATNHRRQEKKGEKGRMTPLSWRGGKRGVLCIQATIYRGG